MMLEQRRPDIIFEIVESRGNWTELLKEVSKALGSPRYTLSNVFITQHTTDMKSVYSRARVLLAPSLWFESFGRVTAEACMNGIPVIYTYRGGLPEVVGDGGIMIDLPAEYYERPYQKIPPFEVLQPVVEHIIKLYDDQTLYETYVNNALQRAQRYLPEHVAENFMQTVA